MGSQNPPPSIPTIDFSKPDLNPGTLQWESVKSKVKEAMEDYGCLYALFNNANFDEGLQNEIFWLLKSLYDVPQEKKKDGAQGSNHPFTYLAPRRESPLFENFAIDDVSSSQSLESFVNGLLPQGGPCSSKSLHSFRKEALELQGTIRRMIVENLGLEKHMYNHMSSVQHSLRIQKYEASKTNKEAVGLSPHRDTNTLTVLYPNKVLGLELLSRDGDWVPLTPPSASFVVFMAESLNAWTNGRFHVPLHRVMINAGSEDRYSIGLFSRPKEGYIVQAPEEQVDDEHALLFGPFDYSEFRKARIDSGKDTFDIKAYCGLEH